MDRVIERYHLGYGNEFEAPLDFEFLALNESPLGGIQVIGIATPSDPKVKRTIRRAHAGWIVPPRGHPTTPQFLGEWHGLLIFLDPISPFDRI